MDFSDEEARAVVIIGLPMANINDIDFKAKAEAIKAKNIDPLE
jgi:Rad3-related DNA helicase